MCNPTGLIFGSQFFNKTQIEGRRILEVGSRDVNGGMRGLLKNQNPAEYVGVDIQEGPGVDVVCDVCDLVKKFGPESFDAVITTELMEHVYDWRSAISNLKGVVKTGGVILITTRSPGFKYHGYPHDYWRYTTSDMEKIFEDFDVLSCEEDSDAPGVFIGARKPVDHCQANLEKIFLYSIITGNCEQSVSPELINRVQRKFRWKIGIRRRLIRPVDWILNTIFPHKG